MKKNEKILPESVIELFKENGIEVSSEEAEQLLRLTNSFASVQLAAARKACEPQILKGYRVYVQYDPISEEAMKIKKSVVARIVSLAMKK
jgi:hypothetical protein